MRSSAVHLACALSVALSAGGCRPGEKASATPSRSAVVDSVIPRDEALRRFREGIPRVDTLSDGAATREALVRSFIAALESRDTLALRGLTMTKAEYAWIYYPTTPEGLPPYSLSPGLMWFTLETRGRVGIARALSQRSGAPLGYVGYECDPKPSLEGENRIWGPCVINRRQARGDTIAERLFGAIIERGSRFKFVSYANKLD